MRISEYIDVLVANGKCCFSLNEACESLENSRVNVIQSIDYYKQKGHIVSPAKGFYIIVSPEYRIYGCLPAEYFIPYLMQFWHQDYYAGLLTAAAYHGAAHQKPQVFQIITSKKRPPIKCDKIRIVFSFKKEFNNAAFQKFSTQKSILNISLNHIVTVLAELSENINPDVFSLLIQKCSYGAWQQRMGYVFDELGGKRLANVAEQNVKKQKRIIKVPLVPGIKGLKDNYEYNKKWKIIVNSKIEADI